MKFNWNPNMPKSIILLQLTSFLLLAGCSTTPPVIVAFTAPTQTLILVWKSEPAATGYVVYANGKPVIETFTNVIPLTFTGILWVTATNSFCESKPSNSITNL